MLLVLMFFFLNRSQNIFISLAIDLASKCLLLNTSPTIKFWHQFCNRKPKFYLNLVTYALLNPNYLTCVETWMSRFDRTVTRIEQIGTKRSHRYFTIVLFYCDLHFAWPKWMHNYVPFDILVFKLNFYIATFS